MLFLYFIIQVFHKNYNVLWIGGSLDRVVHDAPVKLFQICLSFYKKAVSGCKSQIFVIGYRVVGRETELDSLSDVAWGSETILIGLETILQIRRLRRLVCGAHGCSAPPPSSQQTWFFLLTYISLINIFWSD